MKLMGSWAQPTAETYQSEKSKQLIESRRKKKGKENKHSRLEVIALQECVYENKC